MKEPNVLQVEVCESTEHDCYQLVHGTGDDRFESRQCWDLSYEVNSAFNTSNVNIMCIDIL